jgi:integrase
VSTGRRGRGDGAVFFEADRGRWVGLLDLGRNGDGKRIRRKVTGSTANEARDALRKLRDEIEAGVRARNGNLTVEAFLLGWLEREVPKFAKSVNTRDNYAWAVRHHLVPGLGSHRLAKLTADHVDDLLEARAARGMAKNSLRRIRAVLVTALDHADRRELVRRNVARLTTTPDGRFSERRSLSAAEALVLLGSMRGDRLETLVIVGVTMGLRPGELTGLSWRDVDLDAGVLHLRRALKRENNRPVMGELKTKRSRRSLGLPPFVVAALRRRQEFLAWERAAAGPDWSAGWEAEQLVFTTTAGTPVDPSNLRRYFRRACANAGIGRWMPYEMRHTAASLLSDDGVPLEHVADLLGHDGTRMVAQVYRHAVSPTVDVAAARMQRLLGGANPGFVGSPPGSPARSDDPKTNADQGESPGQGGGP